MITPHDSRIRYRRVGPNGVVLCQEATDLLHVSHSHAVSTENVSANVDVMLNVIFQSLPILGDIFPVSR